MRLLSVIIPVYQAEETIERCVKSVMRQTYDHMEIIIIDDGSTDQSFQIGKNLAEDDNRVRVIKKEHAGVTAARKAGVEMASGEYITFVDADDWIEEKYFEQLMTDIDDADVVITEYYVIEKENQQEAVSDQHLEAGLYLGKEMESIVEKLITPGGIASSLWNKVMKASLLRAAIPRVSDEIYLFEDLAIMLQVLMAAEKVRIAVVPGYHYCMNLKSLMHSRHKDYLLNLHYLFQFLHTLLESCAYQERLMKGFYRYMRLWVLQAPYYLDLRLKDMAVQFQDLYFPYFGRLKNARIILYGAGYVGMSYFYHIRNDKEMELVAWVDKQPETCRGKEIFEVCSPGIIRKIGYDYIILAVREERHAVEIKSELVNEGVPLNVILWNKTKEMSPVF